MKKYKHIRASELYHAYLKTILVKKVIFDALLDDEISTVEMPDGYYKGVVDGIMSVLNMSEEEFAD